MKTLIQFKTTIPPVLVWMLLVCIGLLPKALAVVPPPDGGYPNFTTAEGTKALQSLTTGAANTAVGWFSLFSNASGSFNTATGAGALLFNTADENTAFGAATLLFNSAGSSNTALGAAALLNNTATGNTAIGSNALLNNTTGGTLGNIQGVDVGPNVAVGWQALESNTVASANTAVGYQALRSFTTGPTGFEQFGFCTAVGFQALANATGFGASNSGFGYQALRNNTEGGANTAISLQALLNNSTGNGNVASGANALESNITGGGNTANGSNALAANITGVQNTANGSSALAANTTGNDNIALGAFTGNAVTTANNVICIGALVAAQNVSDSCFIGNIFGETSASGTAVYVNSDHKLGTVTSSSRFKDDIKPMERVSEALFALKPVTFHYKKEIDPAGMQQFGLVAEDVEKINPDLVVRDKEGKPYSVRYEQVNAMLLNEFLKEHRRNEEQGATIAGLKKEVASLAATVKVQATQIQRVSAQIEISKAIRQTALKNR